MNEPGRVIYDIGHAEKFRYRNHGKVRQPVLLGMLRKPLRWFLKGRGYDSMLLDTVDYSQNVEGIIEGITVSCQVLGIQEFRHTSLLTRSPQDDL